MTAFECCRCAYMYDSMGNLQNVQ